MTLEGRALVKANRIISDLVTALDAIGRHATGEGASLHYIRGMADYAIETCNAQRERNADGYLVVTKGDGK